MRTPWIWCVSLGRWWNVQVYLHMFFVLFVALAFYLSSHSLPVSVRVDFMLTLFASVLLHEVAHIVVARRLGGIADEMVIGPLGGLATVRVPYEPQSEFVALMAGILANAAVCLAAAFALVIGDPDHVALLHMLNPFTLGGIVPERAFSLFEALRLIFWVNWSLLLVNLIPAFPLDGGRMMQAILTMMWPEANVRQTRLTVCRLSQVISMVLLILASLAMSSAHGPESVVLGDSLPLDPQLGWFIMILLATLIFFDARRERLQPSEAEEDEDHVFGYDFSQGYTSLERSLEQSGRVRDDAHPVAPMGLFGKWLENRRASQQQRQLEQEREDEQRVDEILGRLHAYGIRSLSPEDRSLLERVSKRYRSRPN